MLVIDESIPFGNVCDVEITEQARPAEVKFSPSPHGGPETMWFCFRIVRQGGSALPATIRLILKNSTNMLGGGSRDPSTMRPVVRDSRHDWRRLDAPRVQLLPDGRRLLSWNVKAGGKYLEVAWCYPYGPVEVDALVAQSKKRWRKDTIGVSQGSRPIIRLANEYGREGSRRPGLYLIARQHSGETPGSWVLEGFLQRIAQAGRAAPLVWAVPLSNIDGVMGGDYGKDNFPCDLNRAWPWNTPAMRHETRVIGDDIRRWSRRCRPALAIDFHAPGACEADGIYAFLHNPEQFVVQHRQSREWMAAMASSLGTLAKKDPFLVIRYKSRWETPSFASCIAGEIGVPALCVETPYAFCRRKLMTRGDYIRAGGKMAQAVMNRLKK